MIEFVILVVLAIVAKYLGRPTQAAVKNTYKNQKKNVPGRRDTPDIQEFESIREIYFKERYKYYKESWVKFNSLLKEGRIKREEILMLRNILEDSLGDYVHDFDNFKFKSDAHRIYSYMESWHISPWQWESISKFLDGCSRSNPKETVKELPANVLVFPKNKKAIQ